jgi:hypothetical protein
MLAEPEQIVTCNPEVFRQNFNRLPHEVKHTLATNHLFELPAIAQLAARVAARENPHHPKGDIYFDQGAGDADTRSDLHVKAKTDIAKLVHEIEKGQTWIILKHISVNTVIADSSRTVSATS